MSEQEDLIIDDSNFHEYFRDVESNNPKSGDCIAIFRSMAEIHDGDLKQRIVDNLLTNVFGATAALNMFIKEGRTDEESAIKLLKEIGADLASGMTREEVLVKPYTYLVEISYYTKKEFVPKDNKHWQFLNIKNVMIK